MASQLLADGMGPLYREACSEDLGDIIENAARALTRKPVVHCAEPCLARTSRPSRTATARPAVKSLRTAIRSNGLPEQVRATDPQGLPPRADAPYRPRATR